MKPQDLLVSAREQVSGARRRPVQTVLKRAVSAAYYALFHTLATSCADSLVGGKGAGQGSEPWLQVYRALEHRQAREACRNRGMGRFPKEIQNFAAAFVRMQERRHAADYDPSSREYKSDVLLSLDRAQADIDAFWTVAAKDRQAFAVWVLFKQRP